MEQLNSNSFIQFNIKKCSDESPDTSNYSLHKRHVFVMTQVGRPIYVRFGDEVDLSSFLATLAAIIEKWKIYFNADKVHSKMQKIIFSDKILYFFYRKNLCYICCTTRQNESEYLIQTMLEFLNIQLLSIITDTVNTKLDQRPNHDPRSLLGGTNVILAHTIKNGLNSPCFLLNSVMCLPLQATTRNSLHNIIKELKNDNIICTLLLTQTFIIDIYKQKGYDFKTQDILLIQNLLQAQTSLRNSENWIPICLPGVAAEGFIYAYIYFLTQEIAIVMVSGETTSDIFLICQNISKQLMEKLKAGHLLDTIMQQMSLMPYTNKLCGARGQGSQIKHFIIKQQDGDQFTMPRFNIFGKVQKEFKKYLIKYADSYKNYLQIEQQKRKECLSFEKGEIGIHGIYANEDFIILFVFDIFLSLSEINSSLNSIIKWIRAEEGQYFQSKTL